MTEYHCPIMKQLLHVGFNMLSFHWVIIVTTFNVCTQESWLTNWIPIIPKHFQSVRWVIIRWESGIWRLPVWILLDTVLFVLFFHIIMSLSTSDLTASHFSGYSTDFIPISKICQELKQYLPHFTPWKVTIWYQKKAHVLLITTLII